MKRISGILIVGFSLLVVAGTAGAQNKSFEDLAEGADEIRNVEALGALFWSHTAGCGKLQNDLARRQCEGIRKARLAQVTGDKFLVDGDNKALEAGQYDANTKTLPFVVHSCLACANGADVDGRKRFIVGAKGAVTASGPAIQGPKADTGMRPFKSKEAADKWIEEALPRLRTQFVVRIPKKVASWKTGQFEGFKVDVLAYRVYDPCDGEIIAASPKAARLPGDKRYCTGEPVVEEPEPKEPEPKKPEPKEPAIPKSLDVNQIKQALAPAREAARKCYEVYGVPGMARFRITISNKGVVTGLEQLKASDFLDTPTGSCIEKGIRKVTFPESQKKETIIDYPFMLR